MATFLVYTPDQRNDPKPDVPLTLTPPAFIPNDTRSALDQFIDQQWRDALRDELDEEHPLSLNRDYPPKEPLATPANNAAAFSTATTGGTLATGTYGYRVSATDAAGETLASPETTLTIPAALATPVISSVTTATTGGTLPAATDAYRVSAINALGETLPSAEVTVVTTGTTSVNTVNWGAVAGATGYRVYGRTAGGELFIAATTTTTFTDTGAVAPAGALPAANTTATSTNTITVGWSVVTGATGYRVYGRTVGGELFIAATTAATTSYVDTGAVTPSGALPATSTATTVGPYVQ